MSDIEVGNQEEAPQDLDQIQRNIHGAAEQVAKDVNNGKKPTGLGGGNDEYSVMADAAVSKKNNAVGVAMTAYSEGTSNNAAQPSSFMRSGGAKSKKQRKLEALHSMNDAMGTPKSYGQKKADAKIVRKIKSGKHKDNNPMNAPGTGVDFNGNKIAKQKPIKVTRDMVLKNSGKFGAKKLKENNDVAIAEKTAPKPGAIIKGTELGHEDKKQQIKQVDAGQVVQKTSAIAAPAREEILDQVLDKKEVKKVILTKELLEEEIVKDKLASGKSPDEIVELKDKPQVSLSKPPMPGM